MKTSLRWLWVVGIVIGAVGCSHYQDTGSDAGVRSAREFSEATESEARRIYRNGQASSMNEARMKASQRVNTNWATESRRIEKKRAQQKFNQELSELDLK